MADENDHVAVMPTILDPSMMVSGTIKEKKKNGGRRRNDHSAELDDYEDTTYKKHDKRDKSDKSDKRDKSDKSNKHDKNDKNDKNDKSNKNDDDADKPQKEKKQSSNFLMYFLIAVVIILVLLLIYQIYKYYNTPDDKGITKKQEMFVNNRPQIQQQQMLPQQQQNMRTRQMQPPPNQQTPQGNYQQKSQSVNVRQSVSSNQNSEEANVPKTIQDMKDDILAKFVIKDKSAERLNESRNVKFANPIVAVDIRGADLSKSYAEELVEEEAEEIVLGDILSEYKEPEFTRMEGDTFDKSSMLAELVDEMKEDGGSIEGEDATAENDDREDQNDQNGSDIISINRCNYVFGKGLKKGMSCSKVINGNHTKCAAHRK